jgi:hypothetical protein
MLCQIRLTILLNIIPYATLRVKPSCGTTPF